MVGNTVFTVELETFIVASQRSVCKALIPSFGFANTLGHGGPLGIVLRLLILMGYGHFAKTLSEAPLLWPAHLLSAAGFPDGGLCTHRWGGRRSLRAVGVL